MKRKFSSFILIVVFAIFLTLNACDQPQTIVNPIASKASITPTTIATYQPPTSTSLPRPTPTPTPQPFIENIDLPECIPDEQQDEFMKSDDRYESDFAEMDSYRYRAIYRYKSGEEYAEDEMSIEIKGAHSGLMSESELEFYGFPSEIYRRSHIILTDLHSLSQIETILTEDGAWFQTSDDSGWIEMSQSKPSPVMNFAELYSPLASFFVRGPFPPDLKMMKRIESIDGIEVTHRCYKPEQYEDADEPFDLVNFAWPHYEGVFTGYQDAEIHLWTTDNDSQLLRFAIKGKEIVEVYSEYGIIEHNPPNDFLLWVELSDINQPIEIIPPSSEDVVIMIPDKNIIPRLDVDSPYNQLPLPPDADLVSDSEYKWLKEVESIIEETGITPEIAKLFRPREFMAYINEFEYFLLEEKYDSNWSSVSEDRHPIYETDMKISSLIHFFADNMYDLGWILNDAVLELGYPNKFFLFFRRDNITLPIILEEGGENKARIEAFLPSDEATMDAIQSGWISYNESNSELAGNWITSIAVDQNGRAWIGSMLLNQGLSILSDGTLTNYTDIESEMGMVGIMSMNIDKDGLVWIGTYQDILTFDGESWNNFSEGDPRFIGVTDIVIDNDNNIWVSNETGISVYDGSNWKTYDPQFGGISLYLDDNGQPWITTNGGGVYSLDDETWDEQIPPKLDQQNPEEFNIRAIDFDSLGRLWVVSNGDDLSVFDGEDLTAIDLDDSGLNIQYIRDFSIDQFDRVWLITSDGRLFMLDTEGDWSDFTPYGSGISFSIPSVFIIDQQGRIWIGSKYDGVAVFTPPIP